MHTVGRGYGCKQHGSRNACARPSLRASGDPVFRSHSLPTKPSSCVPDTDWCVSCKQVRGAGRTNMRKRPCAQGHLSC